MSSGDADADAEVAVEVILRLPPALLADIRAFSDEDVVPIDFTMRRARSWRVWVMPVGAVVVSLAALAVSLWVAW